MQLGAEIINDLRLAWMDVTTLRDTPELFEKDKVARSANTRQGVVRLTATSPA